MGLYPFNEVVIIGELEFNVSGTYFPEENVNNIYINDIGESISYDINYDSVELTIMIDGGTTTFDGTGLLDSLDCWEILEVELIKQLPYLDSSIDNDY